MTTDSANLKTHLRPHLGGYLYPEAKAVEAVLGRILKEAPGLP